MKYAIIFVVILFIAALLLFPAYGLQNEESPIVHSDSGTKSASFDKLLQMRIQTSDGIIKVNLHDYLVGVLSAEMPVDFPIEALKAQAIAARTFALRQAEAKRHPHCDVCDNSACCQGWKNRSDERFTQAVTETDGLVLTYRDALIDATYFSCSGNRTEAALAVWGRDIPYLQSVESPNEAAAPRYHSEVVVNTSEFRKILAETYPEITLQGSPDTWIEKITYTKGGGIEEAVIGGISINGITLRSLFSLASTDISFQIDPNQIVITTFGFGHRVGMSQYGAKAMAEKGCAFPEILAHYYQGIEIQRLYKEKAPLPKIGRGVNLFHHLAMVTTMDANRVSRTNAPATHLVARASLDCIVALLFLPK